MPNPIVIIPTYNEIENIADMVETVMALNPEFDLLIIDDNSPDGTGKWVQEQSKFLEKLHILNRAEKQGLGKAYIAGFHWCLERDYQHIFEMDCDFSHNPKDLIRLYEALQEEGTDMIVGSRYVKNQVNVINWPISRVLLSFFASKYVRLITGMKVADATAGFVGYRRKVLETIDLNKIKFKGYAFQIEMKYTTRQLGFKIKEVPIVFTDRAKGTSKLSGGIIKEAFFGVIQLKMKNIFGGFKPR